MLHLFPFLLPVFPAVPLFYTWARKNGGKIGAGIFPLAIVTVLLYLIVASLEERELQEQDGADYEACIPEVPRFVPRRRRRNVPQDLS
jgi:protein-S-isoprenylcysteine O-methyltransferase Ste14